MVDAIDARSLFIRPEGETIDFKAKAYDLSTRNKKAKFAKDLACLANTPREGNAYIVLGVDQHRDGTFTVLGIEPDIDDATLQSIAASFLEPSPRFLYQPALVDDVLVGLIIIPEDQPLPALPKNHTGEISSARVDCTFGVDHRTRSPRYTSSGESGLGFFAVTTRADYHRSHKAALRPTPRPNHVAPSRRNQEVLLQ